MVRRFLLARPLRRIHAVKHFRGFTRNITFLRTFSITTNDRRIRIVVARRTSRQFTGTVRGTRNFRQIQTSISRVASRPRLILHQVRDRLFRRALRQFRTTLRIASNVNYRRYETPNATEQGNTVVTSGYLPSSTAVSWIPYVIPALIIVAIPLLCI